MAVKCSSCGTDEGSRYHCPLLRNRVLCRDCCIRRDGHECVWWSMCNANDLSQWEW